MNVAHQTDNEQSALWNGVAGHAWVEAQDLLDQMFKPLEDLLVQAVFAKRRGRVLDVGCGTGSTTLAVARLLGTKGHYIGIDISDPMIAAAQARAEREGTPAGFIRADAQSHAFEPAACRKGRCRVPIHRLAESCGKSVHDHGRARRNTDPA
jgi:SAM-dependent methyltransferase